MDVVAFALGMIALSVLRDVILRWIDLARLLDERDRLKQRVRELENSLIEMSNRNN